MDNDWGYANNAFRPSYTLYEKAEQPLDEQYAAAKSIIWWGLLAVGVAAVVCYYIQYC